MSLVVGRLADSIDAAQAARGVSPRLWHRLGRHLGFRVAVVIMIVLALVALVGPAVVGHPDLTNYRDQLAAPSSAHWLGTDGTGRDSLARTVAGARVSFEAALIVFAVHVMVGMALGVAAGLVGGWLDTVISRITDVLLGLPALVLSLAIVGALGPGFGNLVLAMSVTGWAGLAKLARSLSLHARHRLDVIAARMAGIGPGRIALTHVLPGVFAQVLIAATLGLGETILGLAGLSFLGLGVQPPAAEWGSMLNESRLFLTVAPWLLLGPGVGLILTVTSVTLLSDALRDCSDLAVAA